MALSVIASRAVIQLPFSVVGIQVKGNRLSQIRFLPITETLVAPRGVFLNQVAEALESYVRDPGVTFSLALDIQGTAFQRRVWSALSRIKPGYPMTYSMLAQRLDTGARAVGNACRHNPVPLVVPCHRVIAKRGIGGFAGDRDGGLTGVKQWLLDHEAGSISGA